MGIHATSKNADHPAFQCLSDIEQKVKVNSYVLTHAKGLQPNTVVSLDIKGEIFEESAAGDGQFDAFMNALKKLYQKKKMALPELTDYAVRIPPGSNSDALCETLITWKNSDKEFITRGLDSDQTVSATQIRCSTIRTRNH